MKFNQNKIKQIKLIHVKTIDIIPPVTVSQRTLPYHNPVTPICNGGYD